MRRGVAGILLVAVLLLVSCVESDERAVIGLDGRVWFTLHQSMPRAAVAALGGEARLQQMLQRLVQADPLVITGSSACWQQDGRVHLALSGQVLKWWRVPGLLRSMTQERALPEPVRRLMGEVSCHWQGLDVEIRRTVDWRALLAWSRFSAEPSDACAALCYRWHVPVALDSNATRVEQAGRVHVWEFDLVQARRAPLTMSMRLPLLWPVCGLTLCGAAVLFGARWLLRRLRRWRARCCDFL